MSFCKSIFQKDIYELNIRDLQSFFIEGHEETSTLEFKSGEIELNSIYREIDAFLNTEGGLLIIGSPRERKVKVGNIEKLICQGDLIPSTKISNQDNLLRSITSNISPPPYNIKVKEIDYKEGKIYVLDIPQSLTPPHQVNGEGKYYIRLERESKPAPHGLVEALFFKRQKPKLDVQLKINKVEDNPDIVIIEFTLHNESLVTAEKIGLMFEIDNISEIIKELNCNINNEITLINHNIKYQQTFNDSILVKGIALIVKIGVKLKENIFLIGCSCFCKHTIAESMIIIVDASNNFNSIIKYGSTYNDNELTSEELYDFYNKLKKDKKY